MSNHTSINSELSVRRTTDLPASAPTPSAPTGSPLTVTIAAFTVAILYDVKRLRSPKSS